MSAAVVLHRVTMAEMRMFLEVPYTRAVLTA